MSDKIKFILNTSVEYFGVCDSVCSAGDQAAIVEFLDNEELTIIVAIHDKPNDKIQFHHRIPDDEVCLVFYKIPQMQMKPAGITDGRSRDDVGRETQLGILTLEGGMIKSIYNSISRVFSPKIGDIAKSDEYGPELSGLLENLHTTLGSSLGLPSSGTSSLKDEIKYWTKKLTHKSSSRADREMSQAFIDILEDIDKQIRSIDGTSGNLRIEEFLDISHNSLDQLWRLPGNFPQSRMVDILDVIGNGILKVCMEQIHSEDIWSLDFFHVNNLLSSCSDIIDSWMQSCDSLTRFFWPNYSQHPWIGKPHEHKWSRLFMERLTEIREVKSLHKQIASLLSEQEMNSLLSADYAIKRVNPFDPTPSGQMKWKKALQQFEEFLQPIDELLAAALKSILHNHLKNPRQMIFVFSGYENLIRRPAVLELLTIEREQFLQSLHTFLQDLRQAMTNTNIEPDMGHVSAICNECRWLKIIHYQIQELENVSHLIEDRGGYEVISRAIQEIKQETETLMRTNFEIWCGQSSTAVKHGELRLLEDQPVVKFETEGRQLMHVTFNPKLVTFCQDVREFQNQGSNVPNDLRAAANRASKFLSYARQLQQITNFHNTIGDRMVPCQRPIMLKNALELSKLVQIETAVWNDEESVQRYVNTLQVAVTKLSSDNTILAGYHEQAKTTVIKLMNTDLLLQSQVWKDEMRHLREIIAAMEGQNFTNLDLFKLHWDYQLYKVLEYQYISGLMDMNNKLPDIHVDIIFRQRQLSFLPPEEDIREKYFTQLRRFIERPCGFRGLSERSSEIFRAMVENNRHHFGHLFKRAEKLFEKLEEFRKLWMPWVALGCVDVENLCNVHLTSGSDWDRNFRACKNFSQKIAKLESHEETIDCIVVNILPLRSEIEYINRRYWEALTNSLRNSILTDVSKIQDFLQTSMSFLENVAMDEALVPESGMKYEKIMTDMPQIINILSLVREKDMCLAGWCKERVSALDNISMRWEKFQPLMENHAEVLQRQLELFKDQAQLRVRNLHDEAEKFYFRWEAMVADLQANDTATLEVFKERQEQWKQIQERKFELLEDCAKFNVEVPTSTLKTLTDIEINIEQQSKQWELYDLYLTEKNAVMQEEWAIYRRRPYALNDLISKWESSVHSSIDLSSSRIRRSLEGLRKVLPILNQLQSDGLTERHWAKIFLLLEKQDIKPLHSITLEDIVKDQEALLHAAPEITKTVKEAMSEQVVRQALTELDQWSVTANFKLFAHTDSSGNTISVIKDYHEVLNKIGDNQSLLQSAKNSAAYEHFRDQFELWETRLNTVETLITSLSQSQRRWIYLEPVFGAGTLKNEEAIFRRSDKDFRNIMREIEADTRVMSLIKINNVSAIISSLETQLIKCQNNLASYISEKRNLFPRFYFLSNDDLLEILGQGSKDISIIQKHVQKLFPGCFRLGIQESSQGQSLQPFHTIISVQSAEGDILTLNPSVEMQGPIEVWLNNLISSIRKTLQQQIVECHHASERCFTEPILRKYPVQVLSTTRAIKFTEQVEKAIPSMALPILLNSLNDEVKQLTTMKNETKDNLLYFKLRSLLFDVVHFVTVVEQLISGNVIHTSDWLWLQHLKFYLGGNSGQQVLIRTVFAELEYSYEYLGNANKLVFTSLTQKCYLVLTQAMEMGLGGNPFGPAGTGKTECIKALGAMLGRLVLVFNCDENVNIDSMGLILTGIARCGAWGCFDEFNRLQEATLSVTSMLIQPIQTALKNKENEVSLNGKKIPLNHHCGIFITLNPAGVEYGGRQKLPGGIQALFRPVIMQQPQQQEIARVLLFVDGFREASEIADRMVELFQLCARMLSKQRHYDWGLRELKTVLLACGKELKECSQMTPVAEMSVIVQCLRNFTLSKLEPYDVPCFNMLLNNMFPEVKEAIKKKSALYQALIDAFSPLNLYENELQITKALQLHEQMTKRIGVVVVGPPGCGKSTTIALLRQALTSELGCNIRCHVISPKSMRREQLLGRLDEDTRQWIDGVLTAAAAAVNANPAQTRSWIICDGSIDPEWIEALNSVLDDNRLLTLPSGWRIQFGNNINFIFETDSVKHASPATITRLGIIKMSYDDLPQRKIINFKISKLEFGDLLVSFMEEFFAPTVEWIEQTEEQSDIARNCMLRSVYLHMTNIRSKDQFCSVLFTALRSFVPMERHNDFANYILKSGKIYIDDAECAELIYFDNSRSTIKTFYSDNNRSHIWDEDDEVKLVQTAQIKSYLATLRTLLEVEAPFLIIGPAGSAKTLLVQQIVSEASGADLVEINCSSQLTSDYIIHSLRKNCLTTSSSKGREYRPKRVKLILYLKNLERCCVDPWGSSEIHEFLLQLIQRHGFYGDNLEWVTVTGLQICGSVSKIGAIADTIAPRLFAATQILRVAYPSDADMLVVVQNRVEGVIKHFKGTLNARSIAEAALDFFAKAKESFNPALQGQVHYQFSPKVIMKIMEDLKFYPDDDFGGAFVCELLSTFGDRLTTNEDFHNLEVIQQQTLRNYLRKEVVPKIYFVPQYPSENRSNLKAYSHDDWMEEVQKLISVCSNELIIIDKPITEELLDYTAKVTRVLVRPERHLAVIGRPGDGQLEAIYIAATMLQVKLYTIRGDQKYSLPDFYNDLKSAMQTAALEGKNTWLIIDQNWITFLPDIMKSVGAILEGSEIFDLFGEDLESIASSLRHTVQLEGYQGSLDSYFLKRTRQNLHLILLFDLSSPKLNEYFKAYPILYRNMEFLCTKPASNETLNYLPKKLIEMLNAEVSVTEHTPASPFGSKVLHEVVLQQPLERLLQLVRTYHFIYQNFCGDISKRSKKLQLGVDKLSSAYSLVDSLKCTASQQEDALAEKRRLAKNALEMISATMRHANEQKSDMLQLKNKTQVNSEKLKERQREIQRELSEVEPILMEASAAVGKIKSEALSEIRSLRAPPEVIRDILEGVLRLMGIRDTSWNSMKVFLAKRGIKEDIRSLNPTDINPSNCEAVEKLITMKPDSFEVRNAKRASAAAAPLAAWVKACVRYSKVVQSVKPLEKEQNELQQNLDIAEDELHSLKKGLDEVDNQVSQLSGKLNAYTQEAAVLEIKLEEARNILNSAEILIEKLNSEFVTWKKQLEENEQYLKVLDSKSLAISLAINYFSGMKLEDRSSLTTKVLIDLGSIPSLNLRKALLNEQEQIAWESLGLPHDAQVAENAALVRQMLDIPFRTCPVPLIVDPMQDASTWLKGYLQSTGRPFEISSQNNDRLNNSLELAVRFGKILIVNDCSDLRPPLQQIISTAFYVKFNKKQLAVGSKMIDLHEQFRLVLLTNTTKITTTIEILRYLACIPFTTSTVGLSDQLMSKAVLLQNPELERKRVDFLKHEGTLMKQRIDLEDRLLEELAATQGDILRNEKLLNTLNAVKESSSFIDKSLKESAILKETMMAECIHLREFCVMAADFYMRLSLSYDIPVIIYQQQFLRSLENVEVKNSDIGHRIYSELVRSCFGYLARSIPRSCHLILAMCVIRSAYPNRIKLSEWELFVTNFESYTDGNTHNLTDFHFEAPSWMSKDARIKLQALIIQVPELKSQLQLENEYRWKNFVTENMHEFPGDIQSSFHRVLIAQIFRPDLLGSQLRKLAIEILGFTLDSIVQPTVEQLADETTPDRGLLVIAIAESDPASEIRRLAIKRNGKNGYVELSLGKATERQAMEAVKHAAANGQWMCIKNVHLMASWLVELNRTLEEMEKTEQFRLWLLCESMPDLSDAVMYRFVKVLYEHPVGIKNKVRRLILNSDIHSSLKLMDSKTVKMCIVLYIAHSVILERRRYIPQGWSRYYEFGDADLKAAAEILHWVHAKITSGRCDWKIVQYLCRDLAYGGRINNSEDLTVLRLYLEQFFNNQVLSNRWAPMNMKVMVPTTSQMQEYLAAVDTFSEADEPTTFKLSMHSRINEEIALSKSTIKKLRDLYYQSEEQQTSWSKYSFIDGFSNCEKQIKPILALWRKLAAKSTILQTANGVNRSKDVCNPWATFVLLELQLGASCFQEVHSTLSQVYSRLKGSRSLDSPVDQSSWLAVAENQVPETWLRLWSGPQTLVDYIRGLVTRATAAEERYRKQLNLMFTDRIDLTTVFNCKSFFAALKLTAAKKLGKSVKNLCLVSAMNTASFEGNQEVMASVRLDPLKVDGASFRNGKLDLCKSGDYTRSTDEVSPEFYISFVETSNVRTSGKDQPPGKDFCNIPVYSNSGREQLICYFNVPTIETPDTIALSGAALIVRDF